MSRQKKTVAFDELVVLLDQHRRQSQTIVHCHGVFDLVHIGHIRYLQAAKALGDILVVTVTPDRFVNKGPHRPVFDEKLRAQALAALGCVDYVAINGWPTATETLRRLRPHVYAKGAEYRSRKTPELEQEEAEAAALGIRLEFIDEITSSSSSLINQYLSPFPEETDRYLLQLRQQHTASGILQRLEQGRGLRVLVVGEAIIDEYVTCTTLGQSTKSPAVVGRFLGLDRYIGGALAVANHLAPFCREVRLLTMVGGERPFDDWIETQLRDNVRGTFFHRRRGPTIVKRQYRETYFGTPLFEVDDLSQEPLMEAETTELAGLLQGLLPEADLVLAADYGHGMLSEPLVRMLCDGARLLAVNAPANAANLGYHTISKYPRAGYLSMAEQELRLDCRSRSGELSQMLESVARRLAAETAVVTVGSHGCLCYNSQQGHLQAPAVASRIVDRSGAGEAFFAISSLCAALRLPLDQLAFLGNVAGAEAVSVVGNSRFLEELAFRRHVESLLK